MGPTGADVIYIAPPFVYHDPFMTRTLYRYIFRETAVPFVLGMAVFTFVLLMGRLLKLAEMVFAKGVPFVDVCRLILYMLPSFLLVTIPMAFLLAVLLAFGRLSSDSEITAMKASGVGVGSLLPPVLVFAVLTYLATTFVTVYALPWGSSSFKRFLYEVVETRAATSIREKVFNDDFPGLVIYVDNYDQVNHDIYGILIQDERNPDEQATIFAAAGKIVANPETKSVRLHLEDGGIHRLAGKEGYRIVQFASYDLNVNLQQQSKKHYLDEQDMTLGELMTYLRAPQEETKFLRDARIELQKRFALPFACIVFAIIGIPLGIHNQRSGRAGGFSSGIFLLLGYYILMSGAKAVCEKGILPPVIAMWIPNILLTGIGINLLLRTASERPLPFAGTIRELSHRIREFLGKATKAS